MKCSKKDYYFLVGNLIPQFTFFDKCHYANQFSVVVSKSTFYAALVSYFLELVDYTFISRQAIS